MGKPKRERHNLSVSATADVLAEIDRLIAASPVDTTRSGVALAAIRAGLPLVAMQFKVQSGDFKVKRRAG